MPIFLAIISMLISGCSHKQHHTTATHQTHINTIAASEPDKSVDIHPIASPEKNPKPITRRTATTVQPSPTPDPTPLDTPVATVVTAPKGTWMPNEVHLIRGNEIIEGLQRDIGRKPTLMEMQQRLQTHMGLSAPQADQIIATLGLQ